MNASPLRVAWLVGLVLLALAATAEAQTTSDLELKARTHYAAGEYKEALDIYAALYAKTLHPTYLRNIGRCYQNMGEADKAISSFKEYLRKAPDLDAKHRAEIDGFIAEMQELKRKSAPATAPPAEARPTPRLDAVPPAAPASSPATTLTAQASPATQTGEDHPIYTRWWFWTAIGAVAVAGGVTAASLLTAPATPSAATTFGTQTANPMAK